MYEYAGDDPVDFSDPTGLDGCYGCEGNWGPAWGQNPTGGGDGGADGGFVGAFVYQAPAVLANAGGSDIQQGRQTNGGLGEPLAQAEEDDEAPNPQLPEGWAEREIDKNIETVEILDEMGRPEWAHTPGGFVNWLRNLENPQVPLNRSKPMPSLGRPRSWVLTFGWMKDTQIRNGTCLTSMSEEMGKFIFGFRQAMDCHRSEFFMNLLILNGHRYPTLSPNPSYRGTDRVHPTYCDKMPSDHEINKLFMWFLEEGGELGVVHDFPRARRYAELCNVHFTGRPFEVVEVTDGDTEPANEGHLLGYDISAGYNNSLLWWGLKTPSSVCNLRAEIAVLCEVVNQFFSRKLNDCGLFQEFRDASFCREAMLALQSIRPGLYEGGNLDIFQVVGVYLRWGNVVNRPRD